MLEVRQTEEFAVWLRGLRDARARYRILVHIDRFSRANPGDVRPVGEGVSELAEEIERDGREQRSRPIPLDLRAGTPAPSASA